MKHLSAASAALLLAALPGLRHAQAQSTLPAVTVTAQPESALTVPDTAQATAEIQRIPGAVGIVPDTQVKNTPANTVKDVLGWVSGAITQPKSNIDNRVSIRGSGLTRNYGNRGVNVYMDGIPINTADGLFDVFEIDPSAYRYTEVYKGANALRYGANALGGAVNFVTPTGRNASAFEGRVDTGSYGYLKGQASAGGASGDTDYFVTATAQREDGYREHADGHLARTSANLGYRLSPDAETRFYFNANTWRQRLPGELTKEAALKSPREADSEFVRQDQQRNIDSVRLANKTTLRLSAETTVEFGLFGHQRHVDHPIYQYLDFYVDDFGGFARASHEQMLGGMRNRLVTGVNVINGSMDYKQYQNPGNAQKGALTMSTLDKSRNQSAYVENALYVVPDLAVIVGAQYLHARRERTDRFLSDGDQSGQRSYDIFSPKAGLLWDLRPNWQVYGNLSRSAEVPSFDVNTFSSASSSNVKAQTATTFEVGTRGQGPDLNWDVAVYRAELKNELQCLTTSAWSLCSVVNADRTVHQGLELGLGAALLTSAFTERDSLWLNVAYTYSDFRFDGDATYGNNQLPGVPPHYLRTELLYKHPAGYYAGPNVEWMARDFYADNANSLKVDAYAVLNLRLGYDSQGSGWSGYVEGRNLLDERYISTTITAGDANDNSALFNPGQGRSVYAGARYSW